MVNHQRQLKIFDHPLIRHKLTLMRSGDTLPQNANSASKARSLHYQMESGARTLELLKTDEIPLLRDTH